MHKKRLKCIAQDKDGSAVVNEAASSAVAHSSAISQTLRYIAQTKESEKQRKKDYMKNSV